MKANHPRKKRTFDYPEVTEGSKLAADARSSANRLSDAKREELFKLGMQQIYGGGSVKKAVRSGHQRPT